MKSLVHRLLFSITGLLVRAWRPSWSNQSVRRSLWAGTPILNMAINAKAEQILGVQADSLVYETYFITDRFTYNLSRWRRVPIVRHLLPYGVLLWAAARYQRFHFYCDRGLLPSLERLSFNADELALLHRLGKQLFFWTYGADVRTTSVTEALGPTNCCIECPSPREACICDESAGQKNISMIRHHATALFSMGDMIEYTPGSRNDLFFWPVDLEHEGGNPYRPHYPNPNGSNPIRIVHAPNHRHFKGTRYLIDAVEKLQSQGFDLDLVLVEHVPNNQALDLYRSADLIFDQCLVGFHGYFALEAMALGKPVLCSIRKPELYLLHPEKCPIINVSRETLQDLLKELASDRSRLHELGIQGRRYIENYFSLSAFADRLHTAYLELGATS